MHQDRNFDDIARHFERKIYGGLKGQIRLAVLKKDIFEAIETHFANRDCQTPLRVLDVGAGLAQISVALADLGYDVTVNDVSQNMIDIAKKSSKNKITWHICPYQSLDDKLSAKYDIILCHALLEWLQNPKQIMAFFDKWLAKNGLLSLCFYNEASFVYRNLIMGNFKLLNSDFKADNKSLTPNNPVCKDQVFAWLKNDYTIYQTSGLRVFYDYTPLKRGGLLSDDDVIDMELKYSRQEPFKWLGRYLHILAVKL